jgi:hypothetical protein
MLITVLACLALVWLFGAVVIVAVCRMAARGDALPDDSWPERCQLEHVTAPAGRARAARFAG